MSSASLTLWSPLGGKGCGYLCGDVEGWSRLQVVLGHFNWFTVAMVTSDVALRDRRRVLGQFARGEAQVKLTCRDSVTAVPTVGSGVF